MCDDDSGPGGSEEDGDPRTPRDPQLRAGEAAAESRADREPCRDMEDSDASPRKVPRQAYGEGPGRKRSGPPSILYTFARAGVVIGRTACCRPPLHPLYVHAGRGCDRAHGLLPSPPFTPPDTPAPLCPYLCLHVYLCPSVWDVCALRDFLCCLRPPRCVSTGPAVVRLAGMANERERER